MDERTSPAGPYRPIGYWLKHLDSLIDAGFDRALAAGRLGRRDWQVLNLIHREPATTGKIEAALAPFLRSDPAALGAVTGELEARGWVATDDGRLHLTEAGAVAHAAILEKVTAARQQAVAGIGDDEYRATVDVLRRMAGNLEA